MWKHIIYKSIHLPLLYMRYRHQAVNFTLVKQKNYTNVIIRVNLLCNNSRYLCSWFCFSDVREILLAMSGEIRNKQRCFSGLLMIRWRLYARGTRTSLSGIGGSLSWRNTLGVFTEKFLRGYRQIYCQMGIVIMYHYTRMRIEGR